MVQFFKKVFSRETVNHPAAIITIVAGIFSIIGGIIAIHAFTSESPQEKLNKMGIQWSADNFLDSVRIGNSEAVKLFIKGGMSPYVINTGKAPLPSQICFNLDNPEVTMKVIMKYHNNFDTNHIYEKPMFGKSTLMEKALMVENIKLIKFLVENGVDPNKKFDLSYEGFNPVPIFFQDTPLNYINGKIKATGGNDNLNNISAYLKNVAPNSDAGGPSKYITTQGVMRDTEEFSRDVSRKATRMIMGR